jgi:hypothetical protein
VANHGQELDKQSQILGDVATKFDKELDHVEHINVRMQDNVEKVMKGDKFIMNCVLLVVLIALASFIVTFFT